MIKYIKSHKARQELRIFLEGKIDHEQLMKIEYPNINNIKKLYKYSSISECKTSNYTYHKLHI